MRHRARSILAVGALLIAGASIAPIAQAQGGSSTKSDPAEVKVFHADVTQKQIPLLLKAGQDAHELGDNQFSASGKTAVEVYLTDQQAQKLEKQGVDLTEHTLSAKAETRVEDAAQGVFRPYSGSGGLEEEIVRTGQANPGLTKVESIGKTIDGQDILALKLTKNAKKTKDGSKPSVLYVSNQHAREVDHAGDDQPADALLPGQLQDRQAHQEDRRLHGAVVRAVRQPGRLRLHLPELRHPPVAQEPAGRQRRRHHLHRRRRRPQPQLRLQVGLRRRGFVPEPHE